MRSKKTKLKLNRETVKTLNDNLHKVVGGNSGRNCAVNTTSTTTDTAVGQCTDGVGGCTN
jgi:hypothetical protein